MVMSIAMTTTPLTAAPTIPAMLVVEAVGMVPPPVGDVVEVVVVGPG